MDEIDLARDRRTTRDRRANARDSESTALIAALDHGAVEVLFQPQFAAVGGALIGAEALARWHLADCTVIGGAALFEAAERGGLAARLSRHVADVALAAAAHWREDLQLSLNVTAADLAEANFANAIAAAVAAANYPPERLTLEITEQVLVADLDRSAERLRQLADLGVRIALDDFGAGYASLQHLRAFPVDIVKLDRSFVVSSLENDSTVLSGLIEMASNLGMETVGEGIEEPSQLDMLRSLHCRYAQGFLIARPMPSDRLDEVYAIGERGETNVTEVLPVTVKSPEPPVFAPPALQNS